MQRRAFTLIELLVVISIIAILAAILFPVFSSAKQAAKTTMCISNMKQIGTAAQLYLGDFDDVWYPNARYEPLDGFGPQIFWLGFDNNNGYSETPVFYGDMSKPARNPIRPGLIDPYLKSDAIRKCPNAPGNAQMVIAANDFNPDHKSTYYATHPNARRNEYGAGTKVATNIAGYAHFEGAPGSEAQEPANTLMAWEHGASVPVCAFMQPPNWFDSPPNDPSLRNHFNFLHTGGTTTVWLDGHVRRIVYGQLRRPMFSLRKDIYD